MISRKATNRSRPRLMSLSLLAVLALVVGACGSGGDEISAGPGGDETTPDTNEGESGECEKIRMVFHQPVLAPEAEADISDADGARMVREIGESASAADAPDLLELADYLDTFLEDPDALGPENATRVTELFVELNEWAIRTCPPTEPVWGCPTRDSFEMVGGGATSVDGAPTPEDALNPADKPGLDRVEGSIGDGEVIFAWADEMLVVRSSQHVVERDGLWYEAQSPTCREDHTW